MQSFLRHHWVNYNRNVASLAEGWAWNKDVPLQPGNTRFVATDGSVLDVPTENLGAAKQIDPHLVVIAQA